MSIQEFKEAHQRFIKALKYIMENEQKLKTDPVKWTKVKQNFEAKFEAPMDSAWEALSKEEKKSLSSVYLHRKAQTDPTIQNVIKTFDAEIKSVEEDENPLSQRFNL